METTVIKSKSESYFIRHPQHSYAIFSISENGDLMCNSDYGQANFSWRSFGDTGLENFKKFLTELDEGYWKGKMDYNFSYMGVKKMVVNNFTKNVWPLFQLLCEEFKKELQPA